MKILPIGPASTRARHLAIEHQVAVLIASWSTEDQPVAVRMVIWREAIREAAAQFHAKPSTVERMLLRLHTERRQVASQRAQVRSVR